MPTRQEIKDSERALMNSLLPDEEMKRRKRARVRLKRRLIGMPFYKEKDRVSAGQCWKSLHASAVLSD